MTTLYYYSFLAVFMVVLTVLVIVYAYRPSYPSAESTEGFLDQSRSIEENVISLYKELLDRAPTPEELKSVVGDINTKGLNMYTLRLLLISSDEYERLVKTQSNETAPELVKMIAEREYIERVSTIYKEALQRKIKPELVLPYHDLYINVFKNSDQLLRDMFLDKRYGKFERDVLETTGLDRDKLFALYDRAYGLKDIAVSAWWPSVPTRADIEKNRFQIYENKEIWYSAPPTAAPPKQNYIVPSTSFENTAALWEERYDALNKGINYPWKGARQEEVTYRMYGPSGTSGSTSPLQLTPPILPSTVPPQPITVPRTLPEPQPPLATGPVTSPLGTSALTISPTPPPAPTATTATKQPAVVPMYVSTINPPPTALPTGTMPVPNLVPPTIPTSTTPTPVTTQTSIAPVLLPTNQQIKTT